MRAAIFILISLLCLPVFGQQQKVSVIDFSKGMVTRGGDLSRRFDEASIAYNIDLTRYPGDLSIRKGYSPMFTLTGIDSVLWNGLIPVSYRNGDKQLLAVVDWVDSGFGGLLTSSVNGFVSGIRDSFYIYPDTAALRVMSRDSTPPSSFFISLRITQGGEETTVSGAYDSTRTSAELVDAFLNAFNTATWWTDNIGIDTIDDTALVIYELENEVGLLVDYSPRDDYWDGVWVADTTSDTTAMAAAAGVRIPVTGTPKSAQFRDQVYLVNGVSRSTIYSRDHVSEFPLRAPGEINAMPLLTTGTLDGSYRYAVRFAEKSDTLADTIFNQDVGPLSATSKAYSQQMLLYGFPLPPRDTIAALYVADTLADETKYSTLYIYRTAGDVGGIQLSDSLWLVDTLIRLNKHSEWDVAEYTDTMSDATLRAGTFYATVGRSPFDTVAGSPILRHIPDGLDPPDSGAGGLHKAVFTGRPGAPSFIRFDSSDGQARGLFNDNDSSDVPWGTCVGYLWSCTFLDTITGIYSDTGRSFIVAQMITPDSAQTQWSSIITDHYSYPYSVIGDSVNTGLVRSSSKGIVLVLPESDVSGLVCVLYRSPLEIIKADSTLKISTFWNTGFNGDRVEVDSSHYRHFATEVDKSNLYYIGTFSPGDTIIDSMTISDLVSQTEYRKNSIPSAIKDVIVSGNRLIMGDENGVYTSSPSDSGVFISILNWHPVNPDDGDQVVTFWEQSQGVVKIGKSNSTYQMYPNGNTWVTPELSRHYGVIAPLSYASSPEGDYFFSLDGVRLEDESQYKERNFVPSLASAGLSNFDNLSAAEKSRAVATYFDNKYMLYIPALDTLFVRNKVIRKDGSVTYGWSTWNIPIVASALFNSSGNQEGFTGDSLIFIKPGGDNTIYSFGTQNTDFGQYYIPWEWRSGITNEPDGSTWSIDDMAFYIHANDTTSLGSISNVIQQLIRDDGNMSGFGFAERMDTTKYHYFEQPDQRTSLFWRLRLYNTTVSKPRMNPSTDDWDLRIEAIWLTLGRQEDYGSQ